MTTGLLWSSDHVEFVKDQRSDDALLWVDRDIELKLFDPRQRRDDHGRWSDGDGGDPSAPDYAVISPREARDFVNDHGPAGWGGILFHGTDAAARRAIRREGFRGHVWLTDDPEFAAGYSPNEDRRGLLRVAVRMERPYTGPLDNATLGALGHKHPEADGYDGALAAEGYDGVIDVDRDGTKVVAVFNPENARVVRARAGKRFDPHQRRDNHGRWDDGGGVATIDPDRPDHDVSPAANAARAFFRGGESPADAVTGDRVFPPQRTLYTLDPVEPERHSARYTVDEQRAVGDYVGSVSSYSLNDALRSGPANRHMKQWAKNLDAAMDASGPLGEPVRVLRTVDGATPDKLGLRVGETVEDLGYGSTSADPERTRQTIASITLLLTVSADVEGIWGANPGEQELLLERGVRYHVLSLQEREVELTGEDGWVAEAVVLPPRERRPL